MTNCPKSRLHILEQSVCSNIVHYTLGKVVTTECHRKIKVYGAKRDGFSEWHKGDSSHDWIAIEIKPLQLLSIQKKSFDDETTKLLLFSLVHCWLAEQTWQFLALAFHMIVKRHTKSWFSICRIHIMEVFGQRLDSKPLWCKFLNRFMRWKHKTGWEESCLLFTSTKKAKQIEKLIFISSRAPYNYRHFSNSKGLL